MPPESDAKHPQWTEKDQAYMKQYIEAHPDNRMAWYLLGKQYERSGEQGKANYCYNQAGEIYNAFENVPLPSETVEEWAKKREEQEKLRRSRRSLVRLILFVLLFFIMIGSIPGGQASAPSWPMKAAGEQDPSDKRVGKSKAAAISNDESNEAAQQAFLVPASDDGAYAAAVKRVFGTSVDGEWKKYLVNIPTYDSWWLWSHSLHAILQAESSEEMNHIMVTPLQDPKCNCGEEQEQASSFVSGWIQASEQRLVAKSALTAMVRRHGTAPNEWGKLAKGYPSNVVSGTSTEVETAYDNVYKQYKDGVQGKKADPKAAKEHALKRVWSDQSDPFREPLRIVVDKKSHRLAVVSGNIIVRNYKVGLGGKRTPEGRFQITEKVVDPNGSSTGDFGSRGMTLSDSLYAVHGTNEPDSIGKDRSLGCIRMLREDVEELFDMVPIGTEVSIGTDLLPEQPIVPDTEKRYRLDLTPKQDNPKKIYRWLD
ncbi:L,D-transpeptidase [Paenibacillus sp. MER TA 81-3]|uniref:L,D-transpeptidase family protein n=1 Tax=Paenibacillus sp. MER TA 81-3 TaxID=2939573 RepID=UPI00203A9957|nr:L,D-transpeptidase [Paenibacillus sp. MER TA 81-3]MCM3340370.1 L,D-transpeptidase [Paenibacillus sp. MER TA 81-3]